MVLHLSNPVPTRTEHAGQQMLRQAVMLTLSLAGFPGDDDEAEEIADAVVFTFDECDPLGDDFETLDATAQAYRQGVRLR